MVQPRLKLRRRFKHHVLSAPAAYALDLRMTAHSDDNHKAPFGRGLADDIVDMLHLRAGRVNDLRAAALQLLLHASCYSVRADQHLFARVCL